MENNTTWFERFNARWDFNGEFQNKLNKPEIMAFIAAELTAAREEGKAYWEPSEHHKDVWRNEGAEKAMKQRDAEIDAVYEKGKHDALSCSTTEYQDGVKAGRAEALKKAKAIIRKLPVLFEETDDFKNMVLDALTTLTQEKP